MGRSPRVRRNLVAPMRCVGAVGSISARAEEPLPALWTAFHSGVDLRACGGTQSGPPKVGLQRGRSPRERRNLEHVGDDLGNDGSISARAEEPLALKPLIYLYVSKSQARPTGHGRRTNRTLALQGSISARAEEPRKGIGLGLLLRVDLRVCGGTVNPTKRTVASWGRSPRVRRTSATALS